MSREPGQKSAHNAWWLLLSALVIVLDQFTKYLVATHFYLFESVRLTGFLNLTYVRNTGVAFSLLNHQSRLLFIAIGLLIALAIVVWLLRSSRRSRLMAAALALILGGALGNVIDRVRLGYVVDFIDFHVANWHWPAFNVADSAVTVGAVLLVLLALKSEQTNRDSTDDRGS